MQVPSGFSKSDSKLVWRFSFGINITDLSDECDGDLHFLHFPLKGRVYEQSLRFGMTPQMHQARAERNFIIQKVLNSMNYV